MRAEAEAAAAEASEEGKPMQPPSRCGSIDVPPLESFTSTGGIISAFVWRIGGEDAGAGRCEREGGARYAQGDAERVGGAVFDRGAAPERVEASARGDAELGD